MSGRIIDNHARKARLTELYQQLTHDVKVLHRLKELEKSI